MKTEERRIRDNQISLASYHRNRDVRLARKRLWRIKNAPYQMWTDAKRRAIKKNVPFDIEISDIVIPEFCPVLKIKLEVSSKHSWYNSPTLDRIIPSKGYVRGNILVISQRANTIKIDATVEEVRLVLEYLMRYTPQS